jgi:hypothetical protein
MKIKDLKFTSTIICDEDVLYSVMIENHRITVLDRMTGFGYRDIETGYCNDPSKRIDSKNMWIASGNFDIRDFPELSVSEAIAMIKSNANTLVGVEE